MFTINILHNPELNRLQFGAKWLTFGDFFLTLITTTFIKNCYAVSKIKTNDYLHVASLTSLL